MGTEPANNASGAGELLERSAEFSALVDQLDSVRSTGRGRLVLIAGEAGIGKTALSRAFCEGADANRVLWGACEALYTPRPLGPLLDVAREIPGELGELTEEGASPSALVAALGRELRRRSPTIVVLEDLHWADEATLDVIRLLARRIETVPGMVLATYRDDELDRTHPLRIVLGELPRGSAINRLSLAPLSAAAVAELVGADGVDPEKLHGRTAGNPFFVTEALAAGADVPDTVRDAVLARVARLDAAARTLLDAVAIVPSRAELWLLEALAPGEVAEIEDCVASGVLRAQRDTVSFRHEIARVAVEEALPPDRRAFLHRRALEALASAPGGAADLARLAHHAEAAGDAEAVLRYAPEAGERAAGLGAHREAADQFARALRYAEGLEPARRGELLELLSYECYLTNRLPEAIDARRRALDEHRGRGERLREGDTYRWLSRLAWFAGDNERAEDEARRAVELLESLPPGRELAMAYSNMAQLRMLASDEAATRIWGGRAIELAQRLEEPEILAHALNNVGTAALRHGSPGGASELERSLDLALAANLEEHVARAYTNLGTVGVTVRDHALADRHLEAGIAYCRQRDMDSWVLYMTGWKAASELDQGRWDAAADSATVVLDDPAVSAVSRITALAVIGRLRARRGDPDPWAPLDEALELAEGTGELQRLAPVAAARAEARWLDGEPDRIAAETAAALTLALEQEEPWASGELWAWRRRGGLDDEPAPSDLARPFQLELEGGWEAAAELWTEIGCPYEAALALAEVGDEEALRRSLAELQHLGARPAASRVARTLRELGVRDVRQGPRAATRDNPAGLTAREREVLDLIAEGLRNAEIARRLVISEKTVAHHVSAILRKLDASTRTEAVAEATRLGIVEHADSERGRAASPRRA